MRSSQTESVNPADAASILAPETRQGLRYARWFGILVGLVLACYGPWTVAEASTAAGPAHVLRAACYTTFGIWIIIPWFRAPSGRAFAWGFGLLCAWAVIFVFLMIVSVIFDYMAAAETGGKPGVPGFEGTLIFLSLMQLPVQLFLRKPDLID